VGGEEGGLPVLPGEWLGQRLSASGLPAMRLADGGRQWVAAGGPPAVTPHGNRVELFRAITSWRSASQIRSLDWDADPTAYLGVISPCPVPDED